jgi:hypothetical protein
MEHELTATGKGLDLSFLGKPHEHDPRRVYSTTSTDWQARVDFDRLRKDRLARARMKMEEHDLGAVVCFVGENVRYITSVFQGNWKNNIFIRYCVLPPRRRSGALRDGRAPTSSAPRSTPRGSMGNIRPGHHLEVGRDRRGDDGRQDGPSVVEVLKENGVEKEKIGSTSRPLGVGRLRARRADHGQRLAGMSGRRIVKTPDELECLKISARSATRRSGRSSTSGSSRASRRARSPRRSTSTCMSRASTSSTTSSSPPAATPAPTAAGIPTRSSARVTS